MSDNINVEEDKWKKDKLDLFIERKKKEKSNKDSRFRNNYKNYQYDYEEDFYEPNKY